MKSTAALREAVGFAKLVGRGSCCGLIGFMELAAVTRANHFELGGGSTRAERFMPRLEPEDLSSEVVAFKLHHRGKLVRDCSRQT